MEFSGTPVASGSRLIFPSESGDAFQAHRKTIRSELRDTYNRLHSISEDAAFVSEQVKAAFPDFPIVPNQRAGAWYVKPVPGEVRPHAYFKSTDGHAGQHDFNLRTNLSLLSLIKERQGGKRFPDALSKTVPTWCAVLNAARCILLPPTSEDSTVSIEEWKRDGALWTLSSTISRSEHSQIEARIQEWALKLISSSYDLSSLLALDRPLRPVFISPASRLSSAPSPSTSFPTFYPIICVSASKLAWDQDGLERALGFTYVQGSGDDHESWSRGLTADVFWNHENFILEAKRQDVDRVIERVLEEERGRASLPAQGSGGDGDEIAVKWIRRTGVGLILGAEPTNSMVVTTPTIRILAGKTIPATPASEQMKDGHPDLVLVAKTGKAGYYGFFSSLDSPITFAKEALGRSDASLVVQVGKSAQQSEANDLGVALALILFVKLYNDAGELEMSAARPTKDIIRSRLAWILESFPSTNPSRAVLQKVNELLMSSPRS
ncbi:BQ5605_C002g01637 [Microbotryum silenes-dioicae]|uniref:BQ5605_C002g01637 protein n=1 Tax=Microbotryum silenes-dioicae TaxID=796604 RepID=A0A2X0MU37_9BASI|nr:BQ5605_C002g01637 [Microbotryum silenes-dioicae]